MKEVTALEPLLLERIAERGPMPFAAYMQIALYHPHLGYYARSEPRTGWSGDFVTSPELDPAFGELWARAFEQIWAACGSPTRFEVVEVGPGEGGFAEAVLGVAAGDFGDALRYRLVERNSHLQERQRARLGRFDRVVWSDSLIDLPHVGAGVIFANEVLDNLPVHLIETRNGDLREVCVVADHGSLAFELLPPSSPELERFLDRTHTRLPEGHRIEVSLAAESFVARAAAALSRGALLVVDYGDEARGLVERVGGSLACYSPAGADDDPLVLPGSKDITSHVNWTAVRAAGRRAGLETIGPRLQREVLLSLGLKELDLSLGTRQRQDIAGGRGAAAVESMSRRQALRVLVDAGGLGGLGVTAGLAGIERPPFLT
ncbi:MAG: SAM-dependent methyltransferase [Actinomycetota bacterium]|nr:SAM-dependent methyltransferase [Actinomycetota bacterium]